MTICVSFKGVVACDSWVSNNQHHGYAGVIKLHPIQNVVYEVIKGKGLKVLWYAGAGLERSCIGLLDILKGNEENPTNIVAIGDMLRVVKSIHNSSFTGLFLLEDGSSLTLNEFGRITHFADNMVAMIGVGSKTFKNIDRFQASFTAPQVAWLISKLVSGCGGPIHYADLNSKEIKLYKPTKETIKKIQAFINAELLME